MFRKAKPELQLQILRREEPSPKMRRKNTKNNEIIKLSLQSKI